MTFEAPVLVVSPSEAARRLLYLLLGRAGYDSVTASDGDYALEMMAQRSPCLVVVDLRDPDEEMIFFAALLQKRHPALPALLLHVGTARLLAAGHERAFRLGGEHAPEHFPSVADLQRAVSLAVAERVLKSLRPAVAKA